MVLLNIFGLSENIEKLFDVVTQGCICIGVENAKKSIEEPINKLIENYGVDSTDDFLELKYAIIASLNSESINSTQKREELYDFFVQKIEKYDKRMANILSSVKKFAFKPKEK